MVSLIAYALTLSPKDIAATLSALIAQKISNPNSSARIIDALIEIDKTLLEQRIVQEPYALKWAPMVAERTVHAQTERLRERFERQSAENAPIFKVDRHTLYTVVPSLDDDTLFPTFADRVLRAVLKERIRKAILILPERQTDVGHLSSACQSLVNDLREQKITVQVIRCLEKSR